MPGPLRPERRVWCSAHSDERRTPYNPVDLSDHGTLRESGGSRMDNQHQSVALPVLSGQKQLLSLMVNGEQHDLVVAVHKTLLEVLREDLDLTGTKHGCEL